MGGKDKKMKKNKHAHCGGTGHGYADRYGAGGAQLNYALTSDIASVKSVYAQQDTFAEAGEYTFTFPPGRMGLTFADFRVGQHRTFVSAVEGEAARMGVKPGDWVLKVDGQNVDTQSSTAVANVLRAATGKATTILVLRPVKMVFGPGQLGITLVDTKTQKYCKLTQVEGSAAMHGLRPGDELLFFNGKHLGDVDISQVLPMIRNTPSPRALIFKEASYDKAREVALKKKQGAQQRAPEASGYGQPVQAGYGQPVQAGYGQPVQAGYGQPVQAGYGQPIQAGYGQPVPAVSAYGKPSGKPSTTPYPPPSTGYPPPAPYPMANPSTSYPPPAFPGTQAAPPPPPPPPAPSGFIQYNDPASGRPYWHNPQTNVTSWDRPY